MGHGNLPYVCLIGVSGFLLVSLYDCNFSLYCRLTVFVWWSRRQAGQDKIRSFPKVGDISDYGMTLCKSVLIPCENENPANCSMKYSQMLQAFGDGVLQIP